MSFTLPACLPARSRARPGVSGHDGLRPAGIVDVRGRLADPAVPTAKFLRKHREGARRVQLVEASDPKFAVSLVEVDLSLPRQADPEFG